MVPRPCARALDAGCGFGTFARRLAAVARHVDAIDCDDAVLARARGVAGGLPHVRFERGDFLTWDARHGYDFVSLIAVLHHLPFDAALVRASALLRPGGVLAVLGLHRPESWLDMATQAAVAFPVSGLHRVTRRTSPVGAAIADPTMTLAEIRRRGTGILPGARIRRHLLWRYSLVWRKPV